MPGADDETSAQPLQPNLADATTDAPTAGAATADVASIDPAADAGLADVLPQVGLSWSWQLDFDALLAALNEPAPWNRPSDPAPVSSDSPPSRDTAAPGSDTAPATCDPTGAAPADADPAIPSPVEADPAEPELADLQAAMDAERSRELPIATVAGRIAESLPTGPDLAGWLATSPVAGLEDGALAGMAASYRRLASWAQAGELAVVAQMASRSAAADEKIGVDEEGRPARMPEEACAQVSLALTMSHASASWWSDLAVTLTWRLPATGAAFQAGQIDLGRARLIAEATEALDEETARVVEAHVLPTAGDKTTAQLRVALRRAVIAADPEGAERRRKEAERRAKVSLYPDQDGTASLAGYRLPGVRAAAAMARISALARAMKAAGAGGGIDLLRAQVFLGLLLGTLPYIPPAADGPPDPPPDEPPGEPPAEPPGDPGAEQPAAPRSGDPSPAVPSAGNPSAPSGRNGGRGPGPGRNGGRHPGPGRNGGKHPGPGPSRQEPAPQEPGLQEPVPQEPGPQEPGPQEPVPQDPGPDDGDDPWADGLSQIGACADAGDDDLWPVSRPPPQWPKVTAFLPPGPAAMNNLCPAGGGLLDLQLPWSTLAGDSGEPGHLSRIGPITPAQARYLADLAACDAAVQWRVIVTGPEGQAVAVTRVPRVTAGSGLDQDRRTARAGPAVPAENAGSGGRASPGAGSHSLAGADAQAGLVRRVTLTISQDSLSRPPSGDLPVILERALRTAARATERASRQAAADAAAAGGCAHEQASLGYRPPPRLREYVTARDVTCRFPTCRQPVWRCDLDHSVPYDQGGKTCACNLGGLCRFHHQIKQHRRWELVQPAPGTFIWRTPAGRRYSTEPDCHAA